MDGMQMLDISDPIHPRQALKCMRGGAWNFVQSSQHQDSFSSTPYLMASLDAVYIKTGRGKCEIDLEKARTE